MTPTIAAEGKRLLEAYRERPATDAQLELAFWLWKHSEELVRCAEERAAAAQPALASPPLPFVMPPELAYLDEPPSRKKCHVCGVDTGAVSSCPKHHPQGAPQNGFAREALASARLDGETLPLGETEHNCLHTINELGHCTRCGARPNDKPQGTPQKPEGE